MNFREEIQIDQFALDKEWLNQPVLFHKYAEQAAEAKSAEDKAKEVLRVIEAEIDLDVRKNYKEKYGLEKAPEAAIKATIIIQPEYKGAMNTYLTLKNQTAILKSAVDTLVQKKDALENLVKLHLSDYYSEPTTPNAEIKEDSTNLRESIVKERIKRRRKIKEEKNE